MDCGLNEIDTAIINAHCESSKILECRVIGGVLDEQIEESKRADFSLLETLRDDTDQETREIIISYCDGFVIFGIESFYGCLGSQLKSIGK